MKIAAIFIKIGLSSFGGWSTTALLLEKELVEKQQLMTAEQLKAGVTYAQILPGATQVSIVANAGYCLRGLGGAVTATVSYLLPAVCLFIAFAAIYFHVAKEADITPYLDGLVAALSGVIIANAYKLGAKHTSVRWLWLLVAAAFAMRLWVGANTLVILLVFGTGGLVLSYVNARRATAQ